MSNIELIRFGMNSAMKMLLKNNVRSKASRGLFYRSLRAIHLSLNKINSESEWHSVMRRREAIQLLSEISKSLADVHFTCVSLTPSARSNEEFELRINAFLGVKSLKKVQSIVNKHGLILKGDKGSLLIYAAETRLVETQRRYEVVRTQSADGEIHFILNGPKFNDADNISTLNETEIREIMKNEAQKPLHLTREYE